MTLSRALLFIAIIGSIWLAHSIEEDNKATCDGNLRCIERLNDATL